MPSPMLGLRPAAILRRSAPAAAAGAGVALVGVSVANLAALDGDLKAAVQPPPAHERAVSWDAGAAGPCAPRAAERRPPAPLPPAPPQRF